LLSFSHQNPLLITVTLQSGPAMTPASFGCMEQNTTNNSQKSCSKTLCTCSSSSWLLTSCFSMSFPLCKLQGRKPTELERTRCPPACTAQVISLYKIYSFSHVTPRQPTSLICATSTFSLLWLVPFLVFQNRPLVFIRLFAFSRVKDRNAQQLHNRHYSIPVASSRYESKQISSAIDLPVAEKTESIAHQMAGDLKEN